MRSVLRLLALVALALGGTAAAELVVIEEAIEAQPLDVQLTSGSSGLVYANGCDGCKPMQLVITAATRASFAGKPLPLSDVPLYAQLGGTIFYDKATRIVTRIVVWR
jgi:hypothetical protein